MTDATSVAVPLETPGEDSADGGRWRPLLRRHWAWLVFAAVVFPAASTYSSPPASRAVAWKMWARLAEGFE